MNDFTRCLLNSLRSDPDAMELAQSHDDFIGLEESYRWLLSSECDYLENGVIKDILRIAFDEIDFSYIFNEIHK